VDIILQKALCLYSILARNRKGEFLMRRTRAYRRFHRTRIINRKIHILRQIGGEKIYMHGQEGKRGAWQKARYIVPVGCAELNPMIYFPILTKENFWLPSSN
jgi:hypothetical protein